MGTEPVILLTPVQDHLQGADAQRQQCDPDVVMIYPRSFQPAQVGWVFDKRNTSANVSRPTGKLIKKIQRHE